MQETDNRENPADDVTDSHPAPRDAISVTMTSPAPAANHGAPRGHVGLRSECVPGQGYALPDARRSDAPRRAQLPLVAESCRAALQAVHQFIPYCVQGNKGQ